MIFPSSTSFTPLATLHLPHPHVLHPDACNPVMDLVVLLDPAQSNTTTRSGVSSDTGGAFASLTKGKGKAVDGQTFKTKVALWRMSGSKVWDVEVKGKVKGLAWSLDGLHLSLLVDSSSSPDTSLDPKATAVRCHIEHLSVHTGSNIRSIPLSGFQEMAERERLNLQTAGDWWKMEWKSSGMDWDVGRIGSSSAIIDSLPTVTPVEPPKPALSHPFMLPNALSASTSSAPILHKSLATFPSILPTTPRPSPDILHISHPSTSSSQQFLTGTFPLSLDSPNQSILRLADISDRISGFLDIVLRGIESADSAFREGNKQTLIWREEVESCGANEGLTAQDVHADLFRLLIAGRSGAAVNEWLGNRLTGRTVTKWELALENSSNTIQKVVAESVSPALERLVLLLEELKGWSLTSDYMAHLNLESKSIDLALSFATGLAKVVEQIRQEAEHEAQAAVEWFKWLKYEILRLQDTTNETVPLAVHDVKLTWSFLKNGFVSSTLLSHFPGSPDDGQSLPLDIALDSSSPAVDIDELVRKTLTKLSSKSPGDVEHPLEDVNTPVGPRHDESFNSSAFHSPRQSDRTPVKERGSPNQTMESPDTDRVDSGKGAGDALTVERKPREEPMLWANSLMKQCRDVIEGPTRGRGSEKSSEVIGRDPGAEGLFAERVVDDGRWVAYVPDDTSAKHSLCLLNIVSPTHIFGAIFNLEKLDLRCLAVQFFDDVELVLVLQLSTPGSVETERYLATISYADPSLMGSMQSVSQAASNQSNGVLTIEQLVRTVDAQLAPSELTFSRSRQLRLQLPSSHVETVQKERVTLSLNGRQGRRVGCVIMGEGREVEVLDMDEDEDGDEGEGESGVFDGEGDSMRMDY